MIAEALGDPWMVAADDDSVFWGDWKADDGLVVTAPLEGGAPVPIATAELWPLQLVLDAQRVCWIAEGGPSSVACAPRDGGPTQLIAEGFSGGSFLVVLHGENIYWGTNDSVMTATLDGGAPVVLVTGQSFPNFGVADSTRLYWTNLGDAGAAGSVMTALLDGGDVQVLASGLAYPEGIAVDGAHVYWGNFGTTNFASGETPNGTIMRMDLDGGSPVVLAASQEAPFVVAVDATRVYWTDYGNGYAGGLWEAPLDGGEPQSYATGSTAPFGMALTSLDIVFSSPDTAPAMILRVPKDSVSP